MEASVDDTPDVWQLAVAKDAPDIGRLALTPKLRQETPLQEQHQIVCEQIFETNENELKAREELQIQIEQEFSTIIASKD